MGSLAYQIQQFLQHYKNLQKLQQERTLERLDLRQILNRKTKYFDPEFLHKLGVEKENSPLTSSEKSSGTLDFPLLIRKLVSPNIKRVPRKRFITSAEAERKRIINLLQKK